jgi:hypothetical protein
MKVAVAGGRTALVVAGRLVDAARASGGAIPADPAAMFAAWPDLLRLAAHLAAGDQIVSTIEGIGSLPTRISRR